MNQRNFFAELKRRNLQSRGLSTRRVVQHKRMTFFLQLLLDRPSQFLGDACIDSVSECAPKYRHQPA
jgi:hypothetical protein